MKELFSLDLDIERIIMGIELYSGQKVEPASTLLIFDEIQKVPEALTSLKYFNENAPHEVVPRIRMIWNNIAAQLAKENKKFIYGALKEGVRAFKLYMVDIGLLSCMSRLRQETLLAGNTLFREFKGALTEQYVLQQLLTDKNLQRIRISRMKTLSA